MLQRLSRRLTLFGGWTWVAAASLIGFEGLELVFGSLLLAPEFLPLVILALAVVWLLRERVRILVGRHRDRRRGSDE